MKKFMSYEGFKFSITEVEIERETESSVWIDGKRKSKMSEYKCFHDSFEGAKSYLLGLAQTKVDCARSALEYANSQLGNIKGMKQ